MGSYANFKDDIIDRLRKVEGQVRGIERMVEDDRHCLDILTQIAAVRSAINRVGTVLLEAHARGCVSGALSRGENGDQAIGELAEVILKFVR